MSHNKVSTMLHRRTNKITRVLIYAVLEWTLILLLLLNSLFSYFILKFALYFGLKPPCILCSRLDHLLDAQRKGSKNLSSYTDLICEEHAAEISKIGYCSHHGKLVQSQTLCDGCSSSSSSQQLHNSQDYALIRWMKEIGIGRADEEEDGYEEKRCSCCDVIINPRKSSTPYVNYVANLITEREFDGCFADQDMVLDDTKLGYQVLDDADEQESESDEDDGEDDVVSEAEKVPLLSLTDDEIRKNKEIVTTHNLCPDMLPQHLEFYVDHDDYRLIPIELIDDSVKFGSIGEESKNVVEQEQEKNHAEDAYEKSEISEVSRELDLVFEGDELLAGCEVTKKDLSKEEEKESTIPNTAILEDEEVEANVEIKGISRELDLIFEGDELVSGCKILKKALSSIKEEEESTILNLCSLESAEVQADIENQIAVQACQEERAEENPEDILHKVLSQEEKKVESITSSEIQEEEKKMEEDSQILLALKEEKKREIENLSVLEVQEKNSVSESVHILQEQDEDGHAVHTESQAATEIHSVNNEETESHLRSDDVTDHTERNQDRTENILIELDEPPTPCEIGRGTTTDDPVREVSTSSTHLHSTDKHDGKESKGEAEAGDFIGTIAKINDESLKVEVTVELPNNEVEEERIPDTPTSTESFHHLNKKMLLLARKGSLTEESLDGSIMSEQDGVDGAAATEKLKLELQAERKALRALYSELEEERNASAVAANQTMAMITRLQEEKATMQMEALQYQRMMEEQSEYDQEALQMMNELMVKREKEKQELEKELEVYRKKVMEYEEKEKMRILSRRREASMRSRNSSASCSYGEESDGLSVDLNHDNKDQEEDNGTPNGHEENGHQDTPTDAVLSLHDSLASFEDERLSILEQLKVLEEKLFTLAEEEEEHIDNTKPFEQFYEENGKDFDDGYNDHSDVNGGENGLLNGKHQDSRLNGSMPKRLLPLFDAAEFSESPDGTFDVTGDAFDIMLNKSPITNFELEKKRLAIEEEVDSVYERLQALEADREFLKHCIGSLRKGDKGLDLLQEILQHLRDLKSVELQVMKSTDNACISV